ncbi:kelch-like protein 21 [Octopus bimaculoides]|uniref:BTB domain-containing protein n=1 Tax=Octopus bimaculoides TaxID=37653 RepID=A0A0L8IEP1_OCTBM|nr:kelch-like protein 21 [Octopus bimaculoides]
MFQLMSKAMSTMNSPDLSSDQQYLLQNPNYTLDLVKRLDSLRIEATFTDAILCVQHEEFPCHRNVLAVSSPYFKAMFTSDLRESRESRICISEVSPWTLKRVIEYAYSGRIAINAENALQLLAAGSLFEYPDIVSACCEFLRRQLDHNNCLGIEQYAQVHSCHDLQNDAHKFALENFSMVVKSDEFLDLSLDRLLTYTSSDLIDVRKEEVVYDAVMRWVKYDLDERKQHLTCLLQQVRLPIVDLGYLQEIESDPVISNQSDCLNMVREAQVQHESVSNQQGKRRRSMQNNNVHPRPSTVAKEVLVVVGGLNSYITQSVEMYDVQKDRWTSLPDIPQSLSQYSVAMLTTGLIVTGGIHDGHIVDNVWHFDCIKLEWKSVKAMLQPRARHASTSVNNCVYVIGGVGYGEEHDIKDLKPIERYDAISNTWEEVGQSRFPRTLARIVPYEDIILEVGGLQGGQCVNTIETYVCNGASLNPSGEQYVLPNSIRYAQILVLDNVFYIIWEDSRKVLTLDPEKRTFRNLPDVPHVHVNSGASILRGKIYIAGGLHDVENSVPSQCVECYDPSTNEWTEETSMSQARSSHACLTVHI